MTTEEYQVGYNEGYQDGWNAAQQPQAEDGLTKLRDMLQEAVDRLTAAPKQAEAVPSDAMRRRAISQLAERLETLYTDAHFIFNNPPGEAPQAVRDAIEWYAGSIRAEIAAQGAKT